MSVRASNRLFDVGWAVSGESGLRPAVCGCSGIVSGQAPPGAAVVSHTVAALVRDHFDLEGCAAVAMA